MITRDRSWQIRSKRSNSVGDPSLRRSNSKKKSNELPKRVRPKKRNGCRKRTKIENTCRNVKRRAE